MAKEEVKKEEEKKVNYLLRYRVWKIIDVCLAIIPLLIYGFCNFDKYFGTKTTTLSNLLGFGTLIAVLVIILVKKTEVLNGIFGLIVFEIIIIFLDVYIKDLKFILGMGIIGGALASLITHPLVKKYKRLADKKETADTNASALDDGINKIVEAIKGGRS